MSLHALPPTTEQLRAWVEQAKSATSDIEREMALSNLWAAAELAQRELKRLRKLLEK